MNRVRFIAVASLIATLLFASSRAVAQVDGGIDPEALIERVLMVEANQRDRLEDITFEAEYIEGENKDDGFEEKERFIKKVYLKFLTDTTLFHEEYIEYYKDGELQPDEKRAKEANKRMENKKKRKMRDISYPMLSPFWPDHRDLYDITYKGVAEEPVNDYICHHFRVRAREKIDTLINGDYFFEAGSFQLVQVDFSPAKLVKKMMFRLNQLDMSISYGPTYDEVWLPQRFQIEGKGKAGLFFGVNFGGQERYRAPVINSGLKIELFEDKPDD